MYMYPHTCTYILYMYSCVVCGFLSSPLNSIWILRFVQRVTWPLLSEAGWRYTNRNWNQMKCTHTAWVALACSLSLCNYSHSRISLLAFLDVNNLTSLLHFDLLSPPPPPPPLFWHSKGKMFICSHQTFFVFSSERVFVDSIVAYKSSASLPTHV